MLKPIGKTIYVITFTVALLSCSQSDDVQELETTSSRKKIAEWYQTSPVYMLEQESCRGMSYIPAALWGNSSKVQISEKLSANGETLTLSGIYEDGDSATYQFYRNQELCEAALPEGGKTSFAFNPKQRVELSETNDPSGLGTIFLGQVVAVGRATGLTVDPMLEILLTGALIDQIEGRVTPEAIRAAYKEATIRKIENGSAVWQGRTLPAVLLTVEIDTVNRFAGKYGKICVKLAGIRDEEFQYIRSTLYLFCDSDEEQAEKEIISWKEQWNFKLTSSY